MTLSLVLAILAWAVVPLTVWLAGVEYCRWRERRRARRVDARRRARILTAIAAEPKHHEPA
jgi:hypothetical protein